jgi:hypothetical protein
MRCHSSQFYLVYPNDCYLLLADVSEWLEVFCDALFARLPFPLFRHRVAEAGQGILTNMFEHVAA